MSHHPSSAQDSPQENLSLHPQSRSSTPTVIPSQPQSPPSVNQEPDVLQSTLSHDLSSPIYQTPSSLSTNSSIMIPPPSYLSRSQFNIDHSLYPQASLETIDRRSFTNENLQPAYQTSSTSIEIEIETLPNSPLHSTHPLDLNPHLHSQQTQSNQAQSQPILQPSTNPKPTLTSIDGPSTPHFIDDDHSGTDNDGQSFDDYDWDNDDDLDGDVRFDDLNYRKEGQHQHHRRRTWARRLSPYNIVKFLLTAFIGNIILSLAFIATPLALRYQGYYRKGDTENDLHTEFIYDNIAAWMFWISYNLMANWALHFLVELAPRILILLVGMIWGDVNEGIKTHIETFHTAKRWFKATLYAGMLWGSWVIIFNGIYHLHSPAESGQSRASYTDTVALIVELLFFFTLILSIEKLALLSISMSFHRVAYSDRIQKVTRAFSVIDILQDYRPKRKSVPARPHSRLPSGDILTLKGISQAMAHKKDDDFNEKSTSTHPTADSPRTRWWQRKTKIAGNLDQEKTLDMEMSPRSDVGDVPLQPPHAMSDNPYRAPNSGESDASPTVPMRPKFNRRGSESTFAALSRKRASAAKIARAAMKDPVAVMGKNSGLGLDINNPKEAKKLARRIFFSFRGDRTRNYLVPSDFYPAFPTEELARDAFSIFDSDGNGDISRSEVKNEIFRVYKERRALSHSLKDVGSAIGRLDGIMLGLSAVVFLFIALAVIGVDFSKTLTSIYTIGIAAAFVFKETAANVFDSIILVFCTHPYDTGDRIIMDNDGVEEVLTVKQMGLLVTVFVRWDGTEWFAPNALLGQKFIINLRRSNNQFENATVQFGWSTPLEKIDALEEKLNYWLQTDEQRRFEPGTAAVIQKLVNQQYLEITFGMLHRENWQDWGGRWNRRTAFHAAINYYSRELGIQFYGSEQPIEIQNWNQVKEVLMSDDVEEGGEEMEGEVKTEDHYQSSMNWKPKSPVLEEVQEVRLPEVFGFSPPPESGTGMRRRKKMSRKQAMFGDA